MPNNEFYGRRVSVGLGIETTYGTEVAPTLWPKHMSFDFQRKNTVIENTSAMGRNEGINDSAVVEEWADGTLSGKVYDQTIGALLYNIFGTLVTTANADASALVKNHTFDVATANVAKSLTIARVDPLTSRRHGMGTLDSLEITAGQGDWVQFSAPLKAKKGVTSSDTAAYTAENAFTSKHTTVKLATNVAGLSGATAIPVKSAKLTITRDNNMYYTVGSTDPAAINTGKWTATGELVLRYDATTYETLWAANTPQALSLAFANNDVVIGTSANPSLTFTAPKVRLREFNMSNDLDAVVEQTLGFTCEFDLTNAYMLRGVLTNLKTSY